MGWTSLSFAFGSLLNSTKMTQLYDNLQAMADGDAGAPEVTKSALKMFQDSWGGELASGHPVYVPMDDHSHIPEVDSGNHSDVFWRFDSDSQTQNTAGDSCQAEGLNTIPGHHTGALRWYRHID